MKNLKKPGFHNLPALSYDEMRTIKGGYSGSCNADSSCGAYSCRENGICGSTCCIA